MFIMKYTTDKKVKGEATESSTFKLIPLFSLFFSQGHS